MTGNYIYIFYAITSSGIPQNTCSELLRTLLLKEWAGEIEIV
jgi:hypothetical protein